MALDYEVRLRSSPRRQSRARILAMLLLIAGGVFLTQLSLLIIADRTHHFIAVAAALFPFGLLRLWLHSDDDKLSIAFFANLLFWTMLIGLMVNRKRRSRQLRKSQ